MLTEAIILVGGLGTRLKSVSGNTPKPMVDVAGKPFLYHILDKLDDSGIKHVVLAVGFRYEDVMSDIGNKYKSLDISYSVEEELLGTGGAIAQSLSFCKTNNVLVLNGDTYVDLNIREFYDIYISSGSDISMALVTIEDTSRYGCVIVKNGYIDSFNEKGRSGSGLINAGAYIISKNIDIPLGKYSFEEEILKNNKFQISPFLCDCYFIDIGIPQDYYKACSYFI